MVMWENKPIVVKGNYAQATVYFKNFVKDFETYMQNGGEQPAKWDIKRQPHGRGWRQDQEIYRILPVPPLPTRTEQQNLLPTSAKHQGQRMPRLTASLPRSSSSSTLLHFY
jgi:hypothetical protein